MDSWCLRADREYSDMMPRLIHVGVLSLRAAILLLLSCAAQNFGIQKCIKQDGRVRDN